MPIIVISSDNPVIIIIPLALFKGGFNVHGVYTYPGEHDGESGGQPEALQRGVQGCARRYDKPYAGLLGPLEDALRLARGVGVQVCMTVG